MNTRTIAAVTASALSAAAFAGDANLLANPGFEEGPAASGSAPGWVFFENAFVEADLAFEGSNHFKAFGGIGGAFQDFAAAPGEMWTASAWALNPSFDQLANDQIGAVNIEWRDAGDNLISFETNAFIDANSPSGDTAGDYIFGDVSGMAPDGTAVARIVLISGAFAGAGGGGAVYFDNASFVPAPGAAAGLALAGLVAVRRRRSL